MTGPVDYEPPAFLIGVPAANDVVAADDFLGVEMIAVASIADDAGYVILDGGQPVCLDDVLATTVDPR